MASFRYLWTNRAKFPFGSKSFIKAWVKRLLTTKEILKRSQRRKALVRKGASIHETAEIGEIKAGGNKRNLIVGAYSFIGKVELSLHEKIIIKEKVCINDGVILLTASHDVKDTEWKHVKAPIYIDDFAWISTNVIVLPGVHIGKGAVVGAGAVVTKNVGDYEIVAGNPAKPINKSRNNVLSYNPCEFLAGNQAWLKG